MADNSWRHLSVDAIKAKTEGAISIGPFGSRMKSNLYVPSGVPVVRGNNISDTRELVGEFVYVSPDTADQLRSSNVFPDDLFFPHRGAIGEVGIVPQGDEARYVLSTSLMKLTCDPRIVEPKYVFYFFRSSQGRHALLRHASTVGTPGIGQPLSSLRSIKLPIPPLHEQSAIAYILGILDDKLDLIRRMNETLEEMARAIFKSWFVDFDPVRAKADGRDPLLPVHLANLFPTRLDSELGEIPKRWTVNTLAECSTLNPEAWSKETRPDIIKYVDLSNTKWGRIHEVMEYAREEAPSRAQRVLRLGDTIIGTVRPGNGSYAIVSDQGLTGSTGFAVLRPTKDFLTEFVYLAATRRENIEALSRFADGGAYPAVRPDVVAATPIVRAPDEVMQCFSRFTGPLLERLAQGERESRTLASLRNTLLPKLISGELRVKDAEKFVGSTV